MSKFFYEAVDRRGTVVHDQMEASDKEAVAEYLTKKNLIPTSINRASEEAKKQGLGLGLFESLKLVDHIFMVRNLRTALQAGLSLGEALDILVSDTGKKPLRKVLYQAKLNVQNGQPFSQTFLQYKKSFPPVFVEMLRAGEASGRLVKTLEELNEQLTREYNLRKKITSSLAYPMILIAASVGIVILLLTFVLPKLSGVFTQSDQELPFITVILLSVSEALLWSPILDLVIIAFLVWFFTVFRKTSLGRKIFMEVTFRVPLVRELVKKIALVRFTKNLAGLIATGLTIIPALELSAEAVGNAYYHDAVVATAREVKNGVPISDGLIKYPNLFPRFLVGLVIVGEKTGSLEDILKTFSEFYDEEVDNALKDLTTFIEPALLLVMGLVVGTIALSVLLPIYQLIGNLA